MTDRLSAFEIQLITLACIPGPWKPDFYFSFFSGSREAVSLTLEALVRKKLLSVSNNRIIPSAGAEKFANLGLLFDVTPLITDAGTATVSSPDLFSRLCAVASVHVNNELSVKDRNLTAFFKTERLKRLFPSETEENAKLLFSDLHNLLLLCGAVGVADDSYTANPEIMKKLSSLTALELALTFFNIVYGPQTVEMLSDFLGFTRSFLMPQSDMERILKLFSAKHNVQINPEQILCHLKTLKIVLSTVNNGVTKLYFNPETEEGNSETAGISCDTDMTLTVLGSTPETAEICLFAEVVSCDAASIWKITRSSFFRALDCGLNYERIAEILKSSRLGDILNQWKQDFERIRIYKGTVVQCIPELDRIISSLDSLKPFVIARLAPCIFLFTETGAETWKAILSRIMNYPFMPSAVREKLPDRLLSGICKNISLSEFSVPFSSAREGTEESTEENTEETEPADIFDSFSDSTAKGMDYSGKTVIIREAMKNNRTLLCLETLEGKTVAKPLELIKTSDSGYILKLKNISNGCESFVKVSSVYKVSSLELSIPLS